MPLLTPVANVVQAGLALALFCLLPVRTEAQGVTAVTPESSQVAPSAPDKLKTFKLDRFVPSGIDHKVAYAVLVNPDCSPMGKSYGKIVTPPAHGKISFEEGEDFSSWAAGSIREKCNDKKYPSLRVTYQSDDNFTGNDFARVLVITPDGMAIAWDLAIDVL